MEVEAVGLMLIMSFVIHKIVLRSYGEDQEGEAEVDPQVYPLASLISSLQASMDPFGNALPHLMLVKESDSDP